MTPKQGAALLRRAAVDLKRSVVAAEAESGLAAWRSAVEHSSGPYLSARLALMGHPYSRRRPRPTLPPEYINVQTGAFRQAWRLLRPRMSGDDLVTSVVNRDRKADRLEHGDARTIPRPLVQAVEKAIAILRRRNLDIALVAWSKRWGG